MATGTPAPAPFDAHGDGPIDDCLSIRKGILFIEGYDASRLAERFEPSTSRRRTSPGETSEPSKQSSSAAGPTGPVVVMPSIKANYVLALRRILTEEGAGCDTFGPGELHAAPLTGYHRT